MLVVLCLATICRFLKARVRATGDGKVSVRPSSVLVELPFLVSKDAWFSRAD